MADTYQFVQKGFEYQGTLQNFKRDAYGTLAEMKAVKDKFLPTIFHAMCEETGKLYIYRKSNEVDPVLGKWREASPDVTFDVEEETEIIDFSTWEEFDEDYLNLDVHGVNLDGQGGATLDPDSNVNIDPDDIEPDD